MSPCTQRTASTRPTGRSGRCSTSTTGVVAGSPLAPSAVRQARSANGSAGGSLDEHAQGVPHAVDREPGQAIGLAVDEAVDVGAVFPVRPARPFGPPTDGVDDARLDAAGIVLARPAPGPDAGREGAPALDAGERDRGPSARSHRGERARSEATRIAHLVVPQDPGMTDLERAHGLLRDDQLGGLVRVAGCRDRQRGPFGDRVGIRRRIAEPHRTSAGHPAVAQVRQDRRARSRCPAPERPGVERVARDGLEHEQAHASVGGLRLEAESEVLRLAPPPGPGRDERPRPRTEGGEAPAVERVGRREHLEGVGATGEHPRARPAQGRPRRPSGALRPGRDGAGPPAAPPRRARPAGPG